MLAATDDADLTRAEVLADVGQLQERLASLEGVVRVQGPVLRGSRAAQARLALDEELDLLARAARIAPDDSELRLLEAQANASLCFLLLEPRSPRARECFRRGQDAALAALRATHPGLAAALHADRDVTLPADAPVAPLFWWAFARGAELRARGKARDLARVDHVMGWVLEREPGFFHAGPHLYFALRHTMVGRSLGGDPTKARPHFDAIRELTSGRALLPSVLEARFLAPTLAATPRGAGIEAILAAQRAAWDRFQELLTGVLAARVETAPVHGPGADPGLVLANAVARDMAAAALADPESFGIIPPQDAEVAPEPTPTAWCLDEGRLAGFLLDANRRRAALLIFPEPDLLPPARAALVAAIEAELAKVPSVSLRVAGPEIITHDLDEGSVASFGSLFPVVLIVMAGVLLYTLRSVRVVLAILSTAGLAALWTIGALVLFGRSLNLIVVVTPAILAVLTTAYALHLVNGFFDQDPASSRADAWRAALAHTFRPCLLTAITTAAGFGSLCVSGIPPVRDLGLFAGLGVMIAFGLTFTWLPGLLSLSVAVAPRGIAPSRLFEPERSTRFARALARRSPIVLAVTALIGAASVVGVQRLTYESHVLEFFAPEHRLPVSYAEIEPALFGMTPLEVVLEGSTEAVTAPETLRALQGFLDAASERDLVTRVLGPVPELGPTAAGALLRARVEAGVPPIAASVLHAKEGQLGLRVTLACKTTSSEAFHRLVEELRGKLATERPFPDGVRVRLTGAVPLLVRVQVLLVDTQLSSFGGALLVVTVVLLFAYRSLKVVAVSLLPNVLPILLTLGGMGYLGIPLNTATVTVAGIALGLVVHDTIHFLHHHHHARQAGESSVQAVASTLVVVGRPIGTTTLAVALGFGAFAFSPFRPTFFFGVLIALTCLAALICDLVALPALLTVREREA